MQAYQLEPLDTLFFRDGRPFNLGETGQMEVEAHFPPAPTTVVGAMRAALARGQGWQSGDWPAEIKQTLGDGSDLAGLHFQGPYVMRDARPLFPAPLLLMGKKQRAESGDQGNEFDNRPVWNRLTRLAPSRIALETDRGAMRLPQVVGGTDGLEVLEDAYLTVDGMKRVLEGGVPDEETHVIPREALWATEARVGIWRDRQTRTTPEDALYLTRHVRLRRDVSLGVHVEGVPTHWAPLTPAPLGGESRTVWIEASESEMALPPAPSLDATGGTLRYTVTLITPGAPRDASWRETGQPLFGLPGEIVSACVGKPHMIGGWDSLNRSPRPLKPHLPPGSTWFLEADAGDREAILQRHGQHIGHHQAWGYGQILIGTWQEVQ